MLDILNNVVATYNISGSPDIVYNYTTIYNLTNTQYQYTATLPNGAVAIISLSVYNTSEIVEFANQTTYIQPQTLKVFSYTNTHAYAHMRAHTHNTHAHAVTHTHNHARTYTHS